MKRREVVEAYKHQTLVTIDVQEVHRLRKKYRLMDVDFSSCEGIPLTVVYSHLDDEATGLCRVKGGTAKANGTIWASDEFVVPIQAIVYYEKSIKSQETSAENATGNQLSLFG